MPSLRKKLTQEAILFREPGTGFSYSNVGYHLLELLIEEVTDKALRNAEDIARFAAASMQENPMLSADYVEWMYATDSRTIGVYGLVFDAYGFGHYIETLPNGLRSVSHGGQGKGIMTHFQSVPEIGDAFVILTNSQRSWPFISYLLSDWAQWRSFLSVGMGRIIWGQYGLSAIIGMLLSASL